MVDVLKQSALSLELQIGLLLIAERSFDLYELEVIGFSVPAEDPGSAVSITTSQVSSSFGNRDDTFGFWFCLAPFFF